MRKAVLLFTVLLIFIQVYGQYEKKITILHTNDIHSRLIGYSPESGYTPFTINDDNTIGGFARIASIIKDETVKNEGITLVVDAGDFLMGTLFQGMEPSTGFQLRLMQTAGYDVLGIGNHEFDLGPGMLAEIINSGRNNGNIPPLLLSNAVFDKTSPEDDSLENLFSENIIARKLIIEKGGLKIGIFSLLGKVAVDNAAFAPPVTFASQIKTARKLVKQLKDEKCDLVICISHSGVEKDKDGNWAGEDVKLAQKVKGIDVIVSGHTHTKLDNPLIVNGVPIVQTGEYGQYVGKLDLLMKDGRIDPLSYKLISVDDKVEGDKKIQSMIDDQKILISEKILKQLDLNYDEPVAETDFQLHCNESGDYENSNLGPLVADAIYSYVKGHVKAGTDISIVAVGVIRDNIQPGILAAPDIFRIMSMGSGSGNVPGYPLAKLYVTGHELKSILEILLVSGKSTASNYCFYSGLRVEYLPGNGLLKKVQKIQILKPDGTIRDVNFSKNNEELYSITANSYMLQFIGIIKKMSFGLINVVPKDAEGKVVKDIKTAIIDMDDKDAGIQEGREWLAIMEYIRAMKDRNGNNIPDIDPKYKNPVFNFLPVGATRK